MDRKEGVSQSLAERKWRWRQKEERERERERKKERERERNREREREREREKEECKKQNVLGWTGSFLATFFLAVAPKAYNRSSLPKNIYLPNIFKIWQLRKQKTTVMIMMRYLNEQGRLKGRRFWRESWRENGNGFRA
jgi:hypothetical protein